jgi:hypothetical protein
VWKDVTNPVGWGWDHGLTIQRKGRRFRAKGFDVSSLAPAAVVSYYVKATGGSDADTGLSWDHALASVATALGKADVDRIYVQAGTYSRNFGWNDVNLTRSCSVIGVGGQAVLSTRVAGLVWALTAGQTYTYETVRSNVQGVFDKAVLDINGDYTRYSNQSSIATVEATPGSWWQSGTTVYVHTVDNRPVDVNVFASLIQYNGDAIGNITVYLENITFEGGIAAFRMSDGGAGQTPKLYAKNCQFKYSTNGNGLTVLTASETILQNCVAAANIQDGFNYHAHNAIIPKAIEIDCVSRNNGTTASDTDNASSCHDGGSILRLNGQYHNCKGPNVVDDAALESWNLGVDAYDSNAGAAGQDVDFMAGTSGVMWLDRCNSHDSENGLVAGVGTTIHKRKVNATVADSGSGTVDLY